MDDKIFDQIHDVDLKKTMETSYIDYAMSVIAQRALPDVRDGLKPVQRRVLYSMIELNNGPDKPHRKCARIVGDTMGKYHPHGDSSIYGALVNMAQEWSTRYPLVDGHGNFGSVDGDGAAAMRYTEARLSNDLVITQLGNIKVFMNSGTKCSDHCFDLGIAVNFIQSRFFHIQNFTTQRKNCLCCTASCCLCRTTRGISLDDKDLTVFRIFVRTVCKFSR
jgi:hypothetical protein